jgi:type II secretory ATPase GspE/PulE/Tfp pilus assembly ATPase PilB-like protein
MISQRLAKRLCSKCKVSFREVLTDPGRFKRYSSSDAREQAAIRRRLAEGHDRWDAICNLSKTYLAGDGCPDCKNRGEYGRVALAEVIKTNDEMMRLLRDGHRTKAINYWRANGGMTIQEAAIQRINEGLISPFAAEEAIGILSITAVASLSNPDVEVSE